MGKRSRNRPAAHMVENAAGEWVELALEMDEDTSREINEILDRKLELGAELTSLHHRLAPYLAVPDFVADETKAMFEGQYRQQLDTVKALERARSDLIRWLQRFEGSEDD